jgi:hypothetical protein
MTGRLATGLLAVILGVGQAAIAVAQPSSADQARAGDMVNKAIQLQSKHDIDGAVALYKQAYCLIPEPALVYNIGTAYQEGNQAAEALSYFRMYLKVAPQGDLVADAKTSIKTLTPQAPKGSNAIATISCEKPTPPKPAPVCIDGAAPIDNVCPPTSCPSGTELRGNACVASEVLAPGSGTTEGTVSAGPSRKLFYAGIGTAGAGAVALGVGIYFGVKAQNASDALSNNMGGWTPALLAKYQEGEDAERNQIIFTIVGGAAVAGGAVMIVLGLRKPSDTPAEHTRLVPFFSGSAAGLAVSGDY